MEETKETHHRRFVLGVAAVALLFQLVIPPSWSSDVYLYGMHGEIAKVHGENPFTKSGVEVLASDGCESASSCDIDYYVRRLSWSKHPVTYGPLAVGLFSLAHQPELEPRDNALVLRIWSSLATLLSVFWIMRLWGSAAALLFGWSPVVFLSAANGGHLEPYLVLCLLALVSLHRWRSRVQVWAMAGILGAVTLIKVPFAGLAAPIVVPKIRSLKRSNAALFILGPLFVVSLGYGLVWGDTHPFSGLMAESTKTMRSILHLVRHTLMGIFKEDWILVLRWVSLLGVGFWALFRLRRVFDEESALREACLIWLLGTTLVFGVFHPWHVLPVWALVLGLSRRDVVFKAWLYLAAAAPLFVYGGWVLWGVDSFSPTHSGLIGLFLFAPPLYLLKKEHGSSQA